VSREARRLSFCSGAPAFSGQIIGRGAKADSPTLEWSSSLSMRDLILG
jgi:hypothetical protein